MFQKCKCFIVVLLVLAFSKIADAQTCVSNSIYPWEWPSHKNWFFAPNLWTGTIKDMSSGAETVAGYVGLAVTSYEGTTIASDDNGNLLFYANGRKLWRNTGGATTLVSSALTTGNEGGAGSNGSAVQGVITVRHPLNPNVYHIFTVDDIIGGYREGVVYFTYNAATNTLSGKTQIGAFRPGEGIAATKHANGVDIWVTVYRAGTNQYHSYLVKCDGSVDPAVISNVAPSRNNNELRGGLAFSYQGDKFAHAYPNATGGQADHEVEVFNFDNATGILTTLATCSDIGSNEAACDVTFSPDGNRVYYSTAAGAIYTYDISSGVNATIKATRTLVSGTGGAYPSIEIAADGNLYKSAGTTGTIKKVAGNLNAGTGFTTTSGSTASGSLGLPSMYLPPQEEPDITEVGPYTTCDAAVDLATNWICSGINAEDATNYPNAYAGTGITNTGTGIFDPATAGAGTHQIIFTRCSVDDTINILVTSCCPDTTLSGSFSPVCTSAGTVDLTTVENGKTGTWTITTTPAGGTGTVSGGNTFNINNSPGGTYVLTFTVAGAPGACVMPTRTIRVNALPVVSVNSAAICAGDAAVTFTATSDSTAASHLWSVNGTGTASTTTGTTAGNYTVQVTDNNGCVASGTGVLTVNALPVVTVNSAAICTGDAAATFTATSDSTAASYLWSANGTGTASNTTGTTAGNYTVQVTDNNGCVNSGTGVLTVNALPVVTVNSTAICAGDAAATFTATSDSTAAAYLWSANGTGTAATTTGTTAGNYTVQVTDNNGCISSGTGVLTVNALPVVTVNSAAICAGDAAATFTAASDSTAASHLWSVNGTGTASTTTGTTAGNYTVQVTDNNGCVASGTGVLTVNALPVVTVNSAAICTGDAAATFTATSDSTAASYLWSANGTGTASTTTGTTAGNYTVQVTDNNGCINSGTGVLTVNALPVVTVNSAAICAGDAAATFTATSDSTAASYLWSANGTGTAATTTGTTAGNYTVQVTDNNGCINTGTGVLTVNALPVVTVNDSTICAGDAAATFTATSDSTAASYLWSVNGTGTAATTTGTTAGNYTVQVTDNNGCINTGTGVLTVKALPIVTVNSAAICAGDAAATFTATSDSTAVAYLWSVNGTGTAATTTGTTAGNYTVQVTDNNGCINTGTGVLTVNALPVVTVNSAAICAGDAAATFTATSDSTAASYLWSVNGTGTAATTTGTTAGNYTVQVADNNGCISSGTGVLTVNALPVVTVNSAAICAGDAAATFTATSDSTAASHLWSVNGTGTASTTTGTTAGNYTVQVTDNNGCVASGTGVLTVNALPVITVNSAAICTGDAAATFTATSDSTAASYLWSANGTGTASTTTGTTAGNYTVQVTDNNGCIGSGTGVLTVNALPVVTVNSTAICAGDAAAIFTATSDSTAASYLWSVNGTGTAATTTGTTAGNYTVQVTDSSGCIGSGTGVLTVNALPVVTVNDSTICAGDAAATFTATSDSTAASYLWSVNGTGIAATTTGTAAGNYTVQVTDNNGCIASGTGVLTVKALPVVTVNDSTICTGDAAATFTASSDSTAAAYLWSVNGSGTAATTTGTTAGNYTVQVTDNNGCIASGTGVLTVNALPVVTVNDTSICAGDAPVTFTATSDSAAASYLWSDNGTGTLSTTTGTTAGNYTVQVTDNNGCIGSGTGALTVNTLPTVTLNDGAICPGSSLTFDGGAGFTYLWQDGSTTQTYTSSQGEQVHVLITDGNGCTARDTATVTLNSSLVVDLGADQSVCQGETVSLNVTSSGFSSAVHGIVWSTGATTDTITVNSTQQVSVVVTDPNGCSGTDTVEVVVNPNPTIALTDTAICAGDAAVAFDAGAGYTYAWSSNGSAVASTQTLSTDTNGTYQVIVTDGNTCKDTATATLTVNALPTVTLNDASICPGSTTTFDGGAGFTYLWQDGSTAQTYTSTVAEEIRVLITDGNSCTARDTAQVTINSALSVPLGADQTVCEGSTVTVKLPAGFSDTTHTVLWNTGATIDSVQANTTQQISVLVTDASGCQGRDTVEVVVHPNPTVTLTDTAICAGDAAVVFDAGAGFTYAWSSNGLAIGTAQTISTDTAGTYQVIVTDGNTCSDTTAVTLVVNALPTVTLSDASICPGSNTTFDGGAGFTYLWQDGSTAQTYTSTAAEEVRVLITDGNNCTARDTAQVAMNSALSVPLGVDQAVCEGETVTVKLPAGFSAATHTVLWNTGSAIDSVQVNSTQQISVIVTDASGCQGTDTLEVVVNPNPVVTVADQAICAGDAPILFDAGAGFSYAWSTNGNAIASTQSISTDTTGTYQVIITDGNGCQDTATAALAVNALPQVDLGIDRAMCAGSTVTFDAGNNGATYAWHDASAGQTYTASAAETVHVTVTNANGCIGRDTALVSIQPGLTVDLGPDQAACEGNSFVLNCGYSDANSTIAWNTGASTDSITVNATGQYFVEVTDAGGCAGSDTVNITINSNPTVTVANQTICADENPVTFDAGTGNGWSYAWSGDANGTAQTYSSNQAGTFKVVVSDANGCIDSTTATLTVNALPTVEIGDTVFVCPGITGTFTATGTATSYLWNSNSAETASTYQTNVEGQVIVEVSNAASCIASDTSYLAYLPALAVDLGSDVHLCSGQSTTLVSDRTGAGYNYDWNDGINFGESKTVNPSSSTTYELFVTDGGGCAGYDTVRVIVHANPVVNVPAQTICEGETAIFDAGNPGATYAWLGAITASTQTVTLSQAGNLTVRVVDVNGCIGSATSSLTVNALPTPSLTDQVICAGDPAVTFTPGANYSAYAWSNTATGTTASVQGTTAGVYTVQVTDANNCSASASATLTVNSLPFVDVGPDVEICEGNSVTVGASFDDTHTLLWNTGATSSDITIDSTATYVLTVTDGNGCQGRDEMDLLVNPFPVYTQTADTVTCFELVGHINLEVTTDLGNNVIWEEGTIGGNVDAYETGDYVFTVTTPKTCQLSDTIVVSEKCISVLNIPNAFTPDGDGTNDYFYPKGINIQDYDFYIFDRWGLQLFHSTEMDKGWDGTYKGRLVQQDVYVYKLYYSVEEDHGGRKQLTKVGTVTVVR